MLRHLTNPLRVSLSFGAVAAFAFCAAIIGVSYFRETELAEYFDLWVESDLRFRVAALENYRDVVEQDIDLLVGNRLVQRAFIDFSAAFDELGADRVRELYVEDNPHPANEKHALDEAVDGSIYSGLHGLYHNWFRTRVRVRDYYDLLLVRPDGRVIYTVEKENDFGRDLNEAPFRDSAIRNVFVRALSAPPGNPVAEEFAPYAPSGGLPSQFVGAPVYYRGNVIGVVVVQLHLGPLASIVQTRKSYFADLKAYVVAGDGRNLTDNDAPVAPVSVTALKGASGTLRAAGAAGNNAYIAFAPLDWFGLSWAAVSELDYVAADRRKYGGVVPLVLDGIAAVLIAAALGWLIAARTPRA